MLHIGGDEVNGTVGPDPRAWGEAQAHLGPPTSGNGRQRVFKMLHSGGRGQVWDEVTRLARLSRQF